MALCSRCRRNLLSRLYTTQKTPFRLISTTPSTTDSTTAQAPPSFNPTEIPAPSSSARGTSHPISATHPPSASPTRTSIASKPRDLNRLLNIRSSIPGGQELRGVAYLKNKPHILAKEDDEYPSWLWGLLDEGKTATGETKVDLAAMTKKQRIKYERRQEIHLQSLPKRIPIHEQSKDLIGPGDDAITAFQRRQEIVKSSRIARRKSIREQNFLRTM